MRKQIIVVLAVLATVVGASFAQAAGNGITMEPNWVETTGSPVAKQNWVETTGSEIRTRNVTVKGDSVRVSLVFRIINDYSPNSQVSTIIDPNQGEYVIVTGVGGSERVHFSPKLVVKLEKLSDNPRAGAGLMDMNICPTQARQLSTVIGPMRTTHEPMRAVESKSICDQKGGCYNGKVLIGDYQTLVPYNGVRLVSNTGNHKYPENSVSFKVEGHIKNIDGWTYGKDWGPTIVLRNVTMENPIQLIDVNAGCILAYLEKITALKRGTPIIKDGDSCYEVVILRDGTIYKNESPPEARFFKN
ncbi:MAG: hypothetical protein WC848_00155 [Parcubacteria group bacterium]|jgi:hypothetical protein